MSKKFKNVTVSADVESTPTPGQVCDVRIGQAYEIGGVVYEHRDYVFPAGRIQQQQLFPGSGGWVNTGAEFVQTAPGVGGFEIPLNGNTAIQYIWVGV